MSPYKTMPCVSEALSLTHIPDKIEVRASVRIRVRVGVRV